MMIRAETPADWEAVRAVNEAAFGQPDEATLVDTLRPVAIASLVAEVDGDVVGHILFTPATIGAVSAAALGPVAVQPAWQGRGIGSRLILEGLAACRHAGYGIVGLLGHPDYYPRFGFQPASRFGIRCKWDVPDEAFMALALRPGALDGVSGLFEYLPAFDEV
jgi:putative acetyltransferase